MYRDVGTAIQRVADKAGCSVVRSFWYAKFRSSVRQCGETTRICMSKWSRCRVVLSCDARRTALRAQQSDRRDEARPCVHDRADDQSRNLARVSMVSKENKAHFCILISAVVIGWVTVHKGPTIGRRQRATASDRHSSNTRCSSRRTAARSAVRTSFWRARNRDVSNCASRSCSR
jgi:hypothetical protein